MIRFDGLIPACAGKTRACTRPFRALSAHPRVCGENGGRAGELRRRRGSSPRVRGKPTDAALPGLPSGLIPACAGKTPTTRTVWWGPEAHPRVCGENTRRTSAENVASGSSPRVRGKRARPRPRRPRIRLIPACAGKTTRRACGARRIWAHPRVCGENVFAVDVGRAPGGSSPRVRGKPASRTDRPTRLGLIPACAGKTHAMSRTRRSGSAHPRVCGENSVRATTRQDYRGSSPRVRGKRWSGTSDPPGARLIPACAGKTPRPGPRARRGAAHPRVCGENRDDWARRSARSGSSPRVRGKHLRTGPRRLLVGLIPACAGKTPTPPSWSCSTRRAHPRVCGENTASAVTRAGAAASSPRVRGKHVRGGFPLGLQGLIPACAGKTHRLVVVVVEAQPHPRVCGENTWSRGRRPGSRRSSPRVRGKHHPLTLVALGRALIPACAGKTHFLTWAFTAQAGRILETLGPYASSGSYSFPGARANGGQCRARRRGLCTGPALGRPLGAS